MDSRPGENTGIHISGSQILSIRSSLQKDIHKRLEQKIAQLNYDNEYNENDIEELKDFLIENMENNFLELLIKQLCESCIIDNDDDIDEIIKNDKSNGFNNDLIDNKKVEPYDFALNDKLRNTYQQFEDLVEDTCKLRAEIPPQLANDINQRLSTDLSLIKTMVDERIEESTSILSALESSSSSSLNDNDIIFSSIDINSIQSAKDNLKKTILDTETVARVAHFN